jgi:DNA modification methylase
MPLEVMRRIVGVLPAGVTVIDPFLGSGTTALACKQLGVPFIGIEMDEKYVEIAKKRIQ